MSDRNFATPNSATENPAPKTQHGKARLGLLLAFAGSLLLTPDTLLIRLTGLEGWSLSAWRGLLVGVTMVVLWLVTRRGFIKRDIARILTMPMLVIIGATTLNTLTFNFAVVETSITIVLTAIATAPVLAAGLSFFVLREATSRLTWIAIAVSLVGVSIVILNGDGATLAPTGNVFLGGLYGLISAFGLALVFVWSRKHPDVPIVLGVAIGTLASGLVGALGADMAALTNANWIPLLLMGVIVMPIATACLTVAPRYTPATNVSLFMLLELVLGPIWVWAGTGEAPSLMMIAGAALVLVTLIVYILQTFNE